MADDGALAGKVALVTGGSRGLGREMVLAFAGAGADVVITSRKIDACKEVAAQVEALGRGALPVACHVGHWEELDGLVEQAYGAFGRVDVLVNNAGMSPLYPDLPSVTEELWDKVLGVNLKGPFRLTALVGTRMAEGPYGGSIINVSSTGSIRPAPHMLPYDAAKAGLNALTRVSPRRSARRSASTPSWRGRSSPTSRRRGTPRCSSAACRTTRCTGPASPRRSWARRCSWRRTPRPS